MKGSFRRDDPGMTNLSDVLNEMVQGSASRGSSWASVPRVSLVVPTLVRRERRLLRRDAGAPRLLRSHCRSMGTQRVWRSVALWLSEGLPIFFIIPGRSAGGNPRYSSRVFGSVPRMHVGAFLRTGPPWRCCPRVRAAAHAGISFRTVGRQGSSPP